MRAIIIDDKDARGLLEQLKLEKFNTEVAIRECQRLDMPGDTAVAVLAMRDELHAKFHYVVTQWLQDQGCNVVR